MVKITFPLFLLIWERQHEDPELVPVSAEMLKGCVGRSAPMGLLEISSPGYNFPFQSTSLQIAVAAMEKVESGISVGGVGGGVSLRQVCAWQVHTTRVSLCTTVAC